MDTLLRYGTIRYGSIRCLRSFFSSSKILLDVGTGFDVDRLRRTFTMVCCVGVGVNRTQTAKERPASVGTISKGIIVFSLVAVYRTRD